jgi:hypothetical protein
MCLLEHVYQILEDRWVYMEGGLEQRGAGAMLARFEPHHLRVRLMFCSSLLRLQAVMCECNHLTDFTYLDETFSYMGLTLTYFEKVGFETSVPSAMSDTL